jgi:nucleoside-diphosphate-sugar epimerase
MLPGVADGLRDPALRVVVTGGGGWLGRAALEILDGVFQDALAQRVAAFGAGARTLVLRSGRRLDSHPFADLAALTWQAPLILHFAYLTRGYAARMPPAAYLAVNRGLSAAVAALAGRCGARGLFLPSSGTVYRPDRTLDHDLAANPYGALKLEDEARFAALGQRHDCPVAILRIFNLSGPFMTHPCHYALGSILRDIAAGRPIAIRAAHPVIRAYTHVGDLLTLGLWLLLRGRTEGPIDTPGAPAIEIGDLARRAAAALGRPDLKITRPPPSAAPPDSYLGDGRRYQALAAAAGLAPRALDDQIRDTAAYLATPA